MPLSSEPLRKLGFLTIGLFEEADPRRGHESTLEIIELGEQLGFDSVWVRHRHLQFGISSPVAVLAAASQRTSRIDLGTAVIPLGWENPLRLAEDLATVDILSGGRLNPGISVGPPMHIRTFRAHHREGERARVSQGLVVIPTDTASPEQRRKYAEFAEKRMPRTAAPQGPARLLFAPDLVGTSAQIAERLYAHAAFREVDEVTFALPFTFGHEDYVQILTDIATKLGPALGWRPAPLRGPNER